MKTKNLIGITFSKLTVLERLGNDKGGRCLWLCECICGGITKVRTDKLTTRNTKSCGCLINEKLIERSTKHGLKHHKLYSVWQNMKSRCYYNKRKQFKDWGGRGIKLCEEWRNDFKVFYDWAISNEYAEGLTIDRIDNGGNYEPNNCRFVTIQENLKNKRTNKITILETQKPKTDGI